MDFAVTQKGEPMRAIDADELSKTIKETCLLAKPWDYVLIERTITDAPTIEPERKRGQWIAHPGGKLVGFPYMHYECDQCRAFEPTETNYCPNCGAYMGGANCD